MSRKKRTRAEGEDFVVVRYFTQSNEISLITKYPMTLHNTVMWLEKKALPLPDPRHVYKIMRMEQL